MENYTISFKDNQFHLEGFPDAVKFIALHGTDAERLADLNLNKVDLDFSSECLTQLNDPAGNPEIVRKALWRSAIIHYIKCFATGVRFKLDYEIIYKGEPSAALEFFKYFDSLRDKHISHDVNAYLQSLPGAVLNPLTKPQKIEKVVCANFLVVTLDQINFSNFNLLIQKARTWVVAEFDSLCEKITKELEVYSYEELLKRDPVTYSVPKDVSKPRKRTSSTL